MGKHRTPYPAEFRAQMVELVKAGRGPEELEKEFGKFQPSCRLNVAFMRSFFAPGFAPVGEFFWWLVFPDSSTQS
jgi:hypothetical protein